MYLTIKTTKGRMELRQLSLEARYAAIQWMDLQDTDQIIYVE